MSASALPAPAQVPDERIEPVFIASERGPLYAVHHVPAEGPASRAVVLCPPTGHEYLRCHRALRQMAARFARAGIHALRFDYSGTGDSAGADGTASLEDWRADIGVAIAQCRLRSGCQEVGLVGVRLGASLALQAARGRQDVAWLALWSPVVNGAALVDEWRLLHREFLRSFGQDTGASQDEILGAAFDPQLAAALGALCLSSAGLQVSGCLLLHLAQERADAAALQERLQGAGVTVERCAYERGAVWQQAAMEAIVPSAVLDTIVTWARARP